VRLSFRTTLLRTPKAEGNGLLWPLEWLSLEVTCKVFWDSWSNSIICQATICGYKWCPSHLFSEDSTVNFLSLPKPSAFNTLIGGLATKVSFT
jgi:hypothetical protein